VITFITGLPGNGKTLYAVSTVFDLAEKEGRKVYQHGIPDLTLPHEILEDPKKWFECPEGSIILIDECQKTFVNRNSSSAVPKYVSEFETHRHHGFDIFLITQRPSLVDAHVRALAGRHIHVHRPFGYEWATLQEWQSVKNPDSKSDVKDALKTKWTYPKKYYGAYKSAVVHTHKKTPPIKIILIGGICLSAVLAGTAFAYFKLFKKHQADLPPEISQTQNQQQNPLNTVSYSYTSKSKEDKQLDRYQKTMEYAETREPLIPGLPHTAPRYDSFTRATRARIIKGCGSIKYDNFYSCECRDQDNILIRNLPSGICERFIADGGIFYDHLPDGWKDEHRNQQDNDEQKRNQYAQNEKHGSALPGILAPAQQQ
jgi:zona occludens toxin